MFWIDLAGLVSHGTLGRLCYTPSVIHSCRRGIDDFWYVMIRFKNVPEPCPRAVTRVFPAKLQAHL